MADLVTFTESWKPGQYRYEVESDYPESDTQNLVELYVDDGDPPPLAVLENRKTLDGITPDGRSSLTMARKWAKVHPGAQGYIVVCYGEITPWDTGGLFYSVQGGKAKGINVIDAHPKSFRMQEQQRLARLVGA